MSLETRIYKKENGFNFFKLLRESLNDIYKSRFLAKQLALRDIRAQYRQSFLGIFWAFAMPLATALVWIFLNNSGTIRLTETGIPYPLYAFSGTLLWSIITDSINSPITSTNSARSILSKINFPKEALIISGIYKLLFNTFIKTLLLIFFVVFFGVGLKWTLLLFPFVILGAIIIGTTIGLLLTPIGILYTDIGRMVKFGMQFIMYITPVVYIIPKEGTLKTIMELNPLTPIILSGRDLIVGQSPEYLVYFIVVLICCIPLGLLSLLIYRVSIPIVVERLNS